VSSHVFVDETKRCGYLLVASAVVPVSSMRHAECCVAWCYLASDGCT